MLSWEKLLSPVRRKSLYGKGESMGTGVGRTELERDYDRILFATPTRRMADKTQVFPLEENDSVRTRLTHSHEVSNLARSIGVRLAFEYDERVFGPEHEQLQVKRTVPAVLAAVGLAHDLGNPPFGHQGEEAMKQWFRRQPEASSIHPDFLDFDGNAQTFRLLTRLQVLNDKFGLNLTFATLAALLKYPSLANSSTRGGFKKFGVFESEREVVEDVWAHTGLSVGVRHPFAYVMEACDDIAYSVIDAEDTIKKGYASFYDLMDLLKSDAQKDKVTRTVVAKAMGKNKEFKKSPLSSRELNEVSMQMFRVAAVAEMVVAATDVFVENVTKMRDGSIRDGFELIKNSRSANLCSSLKSFDKRYGFQHRDVLKLELQGNNYIQGLMDMYGKAIVNAGAGASPFERYAYGEISENYRRVFEQSNKTAYDMQRLLCDAVSGMTENYLIRKHDELRSLEHVST